MRPLPSPPAHPPVVRARARLARAAAWAVTAGLAMAGASCSLMAPSDEEIAGSCSDGIRNGGESDVDCGGPAQLDCSPCDVGNDCTTGTDCASGVCEGTACGEGDCNDDIVNGDETDVDCGGQDCDYCVSGQKCNSELDCEYFCEDGHCIDDPCEDGVRNLDETDIDCGGMDCAYPCVDGKDCLIPDDCESFNCVAETCQPV
ncbi:MAG: hypothetical protein WKG00_23210 [Polyangiaceae bacterium]